MRAALAVVVCALAASACDGSNFPSSPTPRNAVAAVSVVTSASVTTTSLACNGLASVQPNIALSINASRSTVFLDSVTLHLVDGSNLSVNSVTFGRARLDAQFGSTRVSFSTGRTFGLAPTFACRGLSPSVLRADLVLLDELGRPQSLTASTTIR